MKSHYDFNTLLHFFVNAQYYNVVIYKTNSEKSTIIKMLKKKKKRQTSFFSQAIASIFETVK